MPIRNAFTKKSIPLAIIEAKAAVVKFSNDLPLKTQTKILRILDEAVRLNMNPSLKSDLIFTSTGIMLGDHSLLSKVDYSYVWDKFQMLFCGKVDPNVDPVAAKVLGQSVGTLIQWRIALTKLDWHVVYNESKRLDIISGDPIVVASYFVPPQVKTNTVSDLQSKFNSARA